MIGKQQGWKAMTMLGNMYVVFPLALIFLAVEKVLGMKLLIGFLGISGIAMLIRLVYFRERPKKRPTRNLYQKIDASSFPSIHAARSFFFAMTLTRYYQDVFIGGALFVVAVLIAFSRYKLRHHYASDIIGGVSLGLVISYLMEREWVRDIMLGL